MSRLFTDDQLREMTTPLCDQARRALEDGDLVRVKGLLNDMDVGAAGVEALVIHTLARFYGEFRQDLGEDAAGRILRTIGTEMMQSFADDFNAGAEKVVLDDLLAIFKHQVGANLVPVTETPEEVVFDLAPCGSGGRFMLDGSVRDMPDWYGPWEDGVPSYCQACKAHQKAFNELVGWKVWTTEISPDVPGRCTLRFRKVRTAGETYYPGRDPYQIAKTGARVARERLANWDFDIGHLLENQHREGIAWHDYQIAQLAYVFAAAYLEGGARYLNDKQESAYNSVFKMFYPLYEQMDDEQNVRSLCQLHHYHFMTFTLTEEADRFAFRLDPCGSGGRLYRGQMWRNLFEYGGEFSPLMKEPHVVNFNRENFPLYCSHCSSHNRAQFRDNVLWFVNDGRAQSDPTRPCVQYYYKKGKKTADVDPELLRQVGMAG